MLKYRIITLGYLVCGGFLLLQPSHNGLLYLYILTIIYVLVITFGSISIRSNFFIKAFHKATTTKKVIALSFDDGPGEHTIDILALLQKYNAKATFFCIGEKVKQHGEIIKQMHQQGHQVANHSFYHKNTFPVQPVQTILSEIEATSAEIEKLIGERPFHFRPPFGVTNPLIARAVKKAGIKVAGWSIRSFDTLNCSKNWTLTRIVKRIAPGKIVLLHDTSNDILWILEQLLLHLKKNNYKTLTVYELEHIK